MAMMLLKDIEMKNTFNCGAKRLTRPSAISETSMDKTTGPATTSASFKNALETAPRYVQKEPDHVPAEMTLLAKWQKR